MPVVTVNVPEAKTDPALKALVREFSEAVKTLRGTKPPKADAHATMMMKSQDRLLASIERMLAVVGKLAKQKPEPAHDFTGMKTLFSGIANDLKDAMKSAYKPSSVRPNVTVKPQVTVSLGGLEKKFDRLETAMRESGARGRNRTFGSNF